MFISIQDYRRAFLYSPVNATYAIIYPYTSTYYKNTTFFHYFTN